MTRRAESFVLKRKSSGGEALLMMLLIGLVMGFLLQFLSRRNERLYIRDLERRIEIMEIRLSPEGSEEGVYPGGNGGLSEEKSPRRPSSKGVRLCRV